MPCSTSSASCRPIIFLSFIIAVSIFLVVNVIIREDDTKIILDEIYSYDIQFKNETTLENNRQQIITKDKISRIEKIPGVKYVRKVSSAEVVIPYQEDTYGSYYKELYQSRYSPGSYEDDMDLYKKDPEYVMFTARFISVDDRGFEVLNESLGNVLDKDDFEKGEIAVAAKTFTEDDTLADTLYLLKAKEEVQCSLSVKVALLTEKFM